MIYFELCPPSLKLWRDDARLAQLVERSAYTGLVGGSNPSPRTFFVFTPYEWLFFGLNVWRGEDIFSNQNLVQPVDGPQSERPLPFLYF